MRQGSQRLMQVARTLSRRARLSKPLPLLLFVTDPARTPDPERIVASLPPGAGVIYRAFGAPDAVAVGLRLAALARRRRLVLLVGADSRLAARIGAHGVHLPERLAHLAPRLRAARPGWLITAAAHDAAALRRARLAGAHAALLSTVFPSSSPSAGAPLGPLRFARLTRAAGLPVYALGGVNAKNAPRLQGSGAVGLAMVAGLNSTPHPCGERDPEA